VTLTPLLDGLGFGEGPRWRDGKLWYSDFRFRHVRTVDDAGRTETIVEVPGQPSGLGWRPDGTMLIVSMTDRRLMRFADGALSVEAELGALAGGKCNDMIVDGKGRAYVGNFGYDFEARAEPRTTCLIRVDPDGSVHSAADELMFPNGTVISPDGRTLVVAETFAHRLSAYDVAADAPGPPSKAAIPTASASTPTGRSGSAIRAAGACCACSRVARSPTASTSHRAAPMPACWAGPTGGPCS